MSEGPCLLIWWQDKCSGPGAALVKSRYFPPDGMSHVAAEQFVFDWFHDRRGLVSEMLWGWGEIPVGVSYRKVDL